MATETKAAFHGQLKLVQWLCGEGGFAKNELVMANAAGSGNLGLVQWLWHKGCPWDFQTCECAVWMGKVEILSYIRENGCRWEPWIRDEAAAKLGYTDDFDECGYPYEEERYAFDDEYSDEYSDDE